MAKIIRREFLGSRLLFWLMCLLLVSIPYAIVYLLEGMVTIEDEIEDPEALIATLR